MFTICSRYFLCEVSNPCSSPFFYIGGEFSEISTYIIAQSDDKQAVREKVGKARNFSLFTSADLRVSLHQLPLTEYYSQSLAIQTGSETIL
jgi:hypothetical protein